MPGAAGRDFVCRVEGKNILINNDDFNKSFLRKSVSKVIGMLTALYCFVDVEAVFLRQMMVTRITLRDDSIITVSMYKDMHGWSFILDINHTIYSIHSTNDLHDFARQLDVIITGLKENAPST